MNKFENTNKSEIVKKLKSFPTKSLAKIYFTVFCILLENDLAAVNMDKVMNIIQSHQNSLPIMFKGLNSKMHGEHTNDFVKKNNNAIQLFANLKLVEIIFNEYNSYVININIKQNQLREFLKDLDINLLKEANILVNLYKSLLKEKGEENELQQFNS